MLGLALNVGKALWLNFSSYTLILNALFFFRRHFVEALMARLDLNAHCDSITGICKQ